MTATAAVGPVGPAPAAPRPERHLRAVGSSSHAAPAWQELARCIDKSSVFFPAEGERWVDAQERERTALAICETCPVTRQCLAAGFASGDGSGVWGGTTPTQRVLLLIREPGAASVSEPVPHPSC